MQAKFILAGKDGLDVEDAKVVRYHKDPKPSIEQLRAEGYTQFILTEQIGYEYTATDGRIMSNAVRDEVL